ncbi:hypothetical protein SAMN05880501_101350 [Ureibacillus xyleni]|uniref:Peptidase S9 prolyl oligopeptidase catalytic domain-containing protein n=1 Tax=Ureibacillus xyleni TaxID=614648 RepID=A0A285RC06_9BACL|nr:prolyl oligopeptidase family serine peptidase [Ureibacillus xyleni]SOB91635.1 hypothetical protein SAMN05880501_101350 [Ureibacillus xyleni]
MYVQNDMWQDIPLLHVYDEKMDEHTPIVIFLHGFQSAKEHNLHYAYQLVKKGVRVILPDAKLHGDRSENLSEGKMNLHFWEIVLNSIQEVGVLYNELLSRELVTSGKIGVAGTSMGGIITSGCLKKYEWISAAAICMGAPGFVELSNYQLNQFESIGVKLPMTSEQKDQLQDLLAEYDITREPEKFNQRPVLFWHGEKDTTVPFKNTYHFYMQLRSYYVQAQDHLKFIVSPNDGHKVPREGVIVVTDWLSQHLE